MAEDEFLLEPDQKHIDYVINLYRALKEENPEVYRNLLLITAEGTEVRELLGKELHDRFNQVWEELTADFKSRMDGAIMVEQKTGEILSDYEAKQKTKMLMERYLEEKIQQFRKDPRILTAFAGKEALLEKALDFVGSSREYASALI